VAGVTLDGLDEVGHEVGAALELHVDVRPRLLGALAQRDEPVVRRDERHDDPREDEEKDDPADRHRAPSRGLS